MKHNILTQLKQNSIAIVSIIIALSGLGYNTWRNENTEYNRNIRTAGFEMLIHVSALQQITYQAHFNQNTIEGNLRKGGIEVMFLRDLSKLMPTQIHLSVLTLYDNWNDHQDELSSDEDLALAVIDRSINKLRQDILEVLETLD